MLSPQSSKKMYLEGLRGFAAIVVVIHHFSLAFYPRIIFGLHTLPSHSPFESWFMESPLYLFVDGNFGVSIFFALSGYVLTVKLLARPGWQETLRSLVKRYFRLTPPILFAVLTSYVFLRLGLFTNVSTARLTGSELWLGQLWNFPPSLKTALAVGTYRALLHVSGYITVLWSMHYEFFGSILSIVLASLSRRRGGRMVAYGITGILLWQTYFFGMLAGTIIADIQLWISSRSWSVSNAKARLVFGPVLIVFGAYLGMYPQFGSPAGSFAPLSIFEKMGLVAIHSLGAVMILSGLLISHHAQHLFGGRVGAFVGRISFSVYLLHALVLASFACWYFQVTHKVLGYNFAAVSALLLSVPVVILFAAMATKFIDQPSVNLANRIGLFVTRQKLYSGAVS